MQELAKFIERFTNAYSKSPEMRKLIKQINKIYTKKLNNNSLTENDRADLAYIQDEISDIVKMHFK